MSTTNTAANHFLVVLQGRPPGEDWRYRHDHGPFPTLDKAKARAQEEADQYANIESEWSYRAVVYPSDARGEAPSEATRPVATVRPSKARAKSVGRA